ncbi:MAG: amidohydrolase [Acidimicrobiia bacterium]
MDAVTPRGSVKRLVSADAVVAADGRRGNAVLIEAGRVVAVGDRRDLADGVPEDTFVGATIVPGLRDAHIHAVPYAALLKGCSLKSARNMADLKDRIASHASELPSSEALMATRFDDESLAERRLPTRKDLDDVAPGHPVVIYRYCGHIAVANSQALSESGIDATTPDPAGGSIDRDERGVPTGVLRETAAGLVSPALARGGHVSEDELVEALTGLAGLGITSIGAMIGYGEAPSEKLEAEVELWCNVASRLPIKVHGIVIADTPQRLEFAARQLTGVAPRLRWLGIKRFADGSLGGHTAAMSSPFADADTLGTYRLTDVDADLARHSLSLGGMVSIHAIGDRAVEGVLDVFEDLRRHGAAGADLRMEHLSVISPVQIAKCAELGITASVQPAFLASETQWLGRRVGRDRLGWVYPFRSLKASGLTIAGSSDCPVEPPNPLWGMAAAMDRYGINEDERLTGLEALAMFTAGAATALREPIPLATGSPADLVVLDVDPETASATDLHNATILETYVEGIPVPVDRSKPTWVD